MHKIVALSGALVISFGMESANAKDQICTVDLHYVHNPKTNSDINAPYLAEINQTTGEVGFYFHGRQHLKVNGSTPFDPKPDDDFALQKRLHKRAQMLLLGSKHAGCQGG